MAWVWLIAASISCPMCSSKYGKCHFSGDSMTPSRETNSEATTVLMSTSFVRCCKRSHVHVWATGRGGDRARPQNLPFTHSGEQGHDQNIARYLLSPVNCACYYSPSWASSGHVAHFLTFLEAPESAAHYVGVVN